MFKVCPSHYSENFMKAGVHIFLTIVFLRPNTWPTFRKVTISMWWMKKNEWMDECINYEDCTTKINLLTIEFKKRSLEISRSIAGKYILNNRTPWKEQNSVTSQSEDLGSSSRLTDIIICSTPHYTFISSTGKWRNNKNTCTTYLTELFSTTKCKCYENLWHITSLNE